MEASQSRFYDDVQADHRNPPVFTMLDRFTHDMIVPGPNTIIIFQHFTFPPANLVWLVCPSVSQEWNITVGPPVVSGV